MSQIETKAGATLQVMYILRSGEWHAVIEDEPKTCCELVALVSLDKWESVIPHYGRPCEACQRVLYMVQSYERGAE